MGEEQARSAATEKREERFKRWLSPDVKFVSPQAENAYKERVTRLIEAIQLEEPDRVPCILPVMCFPAHYAGTTLHTVMHDYDELRRAWLKFLREFDMDTYSPPGMVPPAKALEAVDYKLYKWPGHGLPATTSSYQCVEGEYMKADEYDALIKDPSHFWVRVYMPRIFGALEPFRKLPFFTSWQELPMISFVPFGAPDVQAAFQALLDAGRESMKWLAAVADCRREALESGLPAPSGGLAKAPFDTIGDTLRGTHGVFIDMYRQPGKLIEAMERITPLTIDSAVAAANVSGTPLITIPLHKGADGFMSEKQYQTFYWPTLKKVIMGLIDEGIVPILFAEGSYDNRLEIIKDLPRASVVWYFERTDMARAKEALGDIACIMGNVPASLLMIGKPEEVKEHCRELIRTCGRGGGYILAGGASINEGNPDNLRAMMAAAKQYGAYK
jgi:uroporphyrinogen-III decarboxylase